MTVESRGDAQVGRLGVQLARTDVRFGLAAGALLLLAVILQLPATRLHAESRLQSSPFEWTSDPRKREYERHDYFLYMPKENSLRFFSLGNDTLAAGYVWVKAAGYVTREFRTPGEAAEGDREAGAQKKFEWLSKLYNTVLDLDPHWVGACRIGAMVLAAVGENPSGAIELLERGMSANPDSWIPPYEAGVTMLMWPGHQEEAVRYFRTAVRRPMDDERREVIEHIIPRLVAEAGRLEEAIRLCRARALAFAGDAMGEASKRQLTEFVARQMQLDLEEAVAKFRELNGRFPADVAELRRAGFLARFDLHFGQEVLLFGDRLKGLEKLFREMYPHAPTANYVVLARSGFLHRMVLAGRFEPPEWRDTFGRPFLYHAPTGTVRSEGLAELNAGRTAAVLNSASVTFRMRHGRPAASLEALCAYFAGKIAEGRQLRQEWGPVFKDGRPPEHPLAPFGAGRGRVYEYDPETGRVAIREKRRSDTSQEMRGAPDAKNARQ